MMKHTADEQKELTQLAQFFDPEEFEEIYNSGMEEANRERAAERIREICRLACGRDR